MDYSKFEKHHSVIPDRLKGKILHTDTVCSTCNNELIKKIGTNWIFDPNGHWCKWCMSSFNTSGGCSCARIDVEWLYIECVNCQYSKCEDCKETISYGYKLCAFCKEVNDYVQIGRINWNSLDAKERLIIYGKPKLRQLAKRKNISNYMQLGKGSLLKALIPIVVGLDFPIKFIEHEKNFITKRELLSTKNILYLRKFAEYKKVEKFNEYTKSELIDLLENITEIDELYDVQFQNSTDFLKYISHEEIIGLISSYLDYYSVIYLRKLARLHSIVGIYSVLKDGLVDKLARVIYKEGEPCFEDCIQDKRYYYIFKNGEFGTECRE